jgi:hypothetical protein
MVKVYIEMDQGWDWWPALENDTNHPSWEREMTMEIPDTLLLEYYTAFRAFQDVQEKLETLYRIQEKLKPHPNRVVPEHKLLKEKYE